MRIRQVFKKGLRNTVRARGGVALERTGGLTELRKSERRISVGRRKLGGRSKLGGVGEGGVEIEEKQW